jgi:hypothetical protein
MMAFAWFFAWLTTAVVGWVRVARLTQERDEWMAECDEIDSERLKLQVELADARKFTEVNR